MGRASGELPILALERAHEALRLTALPETSGQDARLLLTVWQRSPEGQVTTQIAIWPDQLEQMLEFLTSCLPTVVGAGEDEQLLEEAVTRALEIEQRLEAVE
jgi:hypothetical protein